MTSEVKVITKRTDTLKVSENEIVDAPDGTGEITQIFIETTELEVSIQEVLSKTYEFLSQKFTLLNTNDKVNAQFENQVLLDLGQHPKTVKLPSIKTRSFSGELVDWPSFFVFTLLKQPYTIPVNRVMSKKSHIFEVTWYVPFYVGFTTAKKCHGKAFHICGLSFLVLQCC